MGMGEVYKYEVQLVQLLTLLSSNHRPLSSGTPGLLWNLNAFMVTNAIIIVVRPAQRTPAQYVRRQRRLELMVRSC